MADFTNPVVVGLFGITNELTVGKPEDTYPLTQQCAAILNRVGFAGVLYHARHDVEMTSLSLALFGKPGLSESEYTWGSEPLADTAEEMVEHYRFRVVGGRPF